MRVRLQRGDVGPLAVAGLAAVTLLCRCGADQLNAPANPPAPTRNTCPPAEQVMPNLFALLDNPAQPLAGLREVISSLAAGQAGRPGGNPLGTVLDDAVKGLAEFADDPYEAGATRCLATSPELPLCGIGGEAAEACENRLCVLRRALDFGLRDQAASKAIADLEPLLGTLLGYMSNTGPAATGQEHYEVIDVFSRTASNGELCSPANLLDVLDGVIVYFRPTTACGTSCVGFRALNDLIALLSDPALQQFLQSYEQQQNGAQGRSAIQALFGLLENALANTPEDSHYFDGVQTLINDLDQFFASDPATYGNIENEVNDLVSILQGFLDPTRPGAILHQLKGVVECVYVEDPNQEIAGALYDVISQPSGSGKGLDLLQIVNAINGLAVLDADGLLSDAIHALLASTRASTQDTEDVRAFLAAFLTIDNAREMFPALALLIDDDVLTELVSLLDNLLYGCQSDGAQ